MVTKRGTLFTQVLTGFLATALSGEDACVMDRFLRSKGADLIENEVHLKVNVKAHLAFYKEAKVSLFAIITKIFMVFHLNMHSFVKEN